MADHPVKMPDGLADQLYHQAGCGSKGFADAAAQWGADQELEACCKWLDLRGFAISSIAALRNARRPKSPTLAEQATTALHAIASGANNIREQDQDIATLAAALSRLAELEAKQ